MMAFMAMNAVLALFLQRRFGVTEKTIGYFYTYVGAVSLVMRSLVLGPAVARFGEPRVLQLGILALGLGFALMPLAPGIPVFGLVVVLVPIGTALARPRRRWCRASRCVTSWVPLMGVQQAYGGVASSRRADMGRLHLRERVRPGAPFWISCGLAIATLVLPGDRHPTPRRTPGNRGLRSPRPAPPPEPERAHSSHQLYAPRAGPDGSLAQSIRPPARGVVLVDRSLERPATTARKDSAHEELPEVAPRSSRPRNARRRPRPPPLAGSTPNPMVGGKEISPTKEGHHRQRRQLGRPHDAGRRGEGRRPGDDTEGHRSLHRLRADQRRLREASGRHGRGSLEAREQGDAREDPHLPCRGR